MRIESAIEYLLAMLGFYGWERVTIVYPDDERHGDVELRRYLSIPLSSRRWYIQRTVVDYDEDAPDKYPSEFTP